MYYYIIFLQKLIYTQSFSTKAFYSLGCFKDKRNRAIPTLEGKSATLDGSYKSRSNPIQKCYDAAKSFGYSVFAVQHGGWCASSATAGDTYNKWGKSNKCKHDGEGGGWANQVYKISNGVFVFVEIPKCIILCSILPNKG